MIQSSARIPRRAVGAACPHARATAGGLALGSPAQVCPDTSAHSGATLPAAASLADVNLAAGAR